MIETVEADGLVFHMNAAQEAVQEGGDTQFSGLLEVLSSVIPQLPVPCGIKEVGAGFSSRAAKAMGDLPLAFLESAGRGGTSWTLLEGLRAKDEFGARMGRLFADWGVPTVTSLLNCVRACPGVPVVASGGIRSGLDIAKCIAMGSTLTASARPMMLAATQSVEAIVREIEFLGASLRNAMFLTGCPNLQALRSAPIRVHEDLQPEFFEGRAGQDKPGAGEL
jgi:isopentenyl-diphosphate delta-isomerase